YKPSVVCVSATPPAAVMHARYLCEQVRRGFPELHIVVGLWNARFDLVKAKARIGGETTTHVVPTLTDALAQVHALVQRNASPWDPQPYVEDAAGGLRAGKPESDHVEAT